MTVFMKVALQTAKRVQEGRTFAQRMTRVVKGFQKHPSSGQFTCTKFSIQFMHKLNRGTQRQFSENIGSEDDLISRIFETFVLHFFICSG